MEIKSIWFAGKKAIFSFACSKCKREVEYSDNYCRNCGRELTLLPREAVVSDITAVLTDYFKHQKKCEDHASGEVIDDHSSVTAPEDEPDWVVRNEDKQDERRKE